MRVKIGAVFAIPINSSEFAYGQVVADTKPKCYVLFDLKAKEHPKVQEIVSKNILLLTYTVDLFLEKGPWIFLGYADISNNITFPNYLVETLDATTVVDQYGRQLRKATQKDVDTLGYHSSVSPAVLDSAARAIWGEAEWNPYYDILLYQKDSSSNKS